MGRNLDDLAPLFGVTVRAALQACRAQGVEMRAFETLRTPNEQAALWRQSRSSRQIKDAIAGLDAGGAPFLAEVLDRVGPQNGRHVTNALPGLSWHQWGEALDCFWQLDGRVEWSTRKKVDGRNGYRVYADAAAAAGATAGGHWNSFKDWPHVQLRADSSPRRAGMSLAEIDAEMQARFA